MLQRSEARRGEHVERVVRVVRDRLGKGGAEAEGFARQLFARAPLDDLLGAAPEDHAGAAISLWKFAAERTPGAVKLRAYNPAIGEHGWQSPHTILEIVNDDMPFLVDSVSGALAQLGFGVQALLHPIVTVSRDATGVRGAGEAVAESVMHIAIDRTSDRTALATLEARLGEVLADVRLAVGDWRAMLARLDETLRELEASPPPVPAEEAAEARALLAWMRDNNFTLLGARDHDFGAAGEERLDPVEGSGLGLLRDPQRRVMRGQGADLPAQAWEYLRQPELVVVLKATVRSTVHRTVPMDYVAVKRFAADGRVIGERRFVGLFTSGAYNRLPKEIPYLRRKTRMVVEQAGLSPASHDGKALQHVLDSYPRDELFQISGDDLRRIALEIVALQERPRIRLFLRRDEFLRHVSCLVYAPRDRFSTQLRLKFEAVLTQAFGGEVISRQTHIGDEPLARLLLLVSTPGLAALAVDEEELEHKLVEAARAWEDDLAEVVRAARGEEPARRVLREFGDALPAAYREATDPKTALFDIGKLETLGEARSLAVNLYRPLGAEEHAVGLKIYRRAEPARLSQILPVIERFGFSALDEQTYEIDTEGAGLLYILDFRLEEAGGQVVDLSRLKERLEAAVLAVWNGDAASDGFNRLVTLAGLGWREVALLRTVAKYLRQAGVSFSQEYMEQTLANNAALAGGFVRLFEARFDPAAHAGRAERVEAVRDEIGRALDAVASLDEDRILRRFLNVIEAAWRTNYYQRAADGGLPPTIAIKLDSRSITDLPAPRPYTEVFVYSPRVEAIHLRGGKVARGGIRWSDRREDFRTEILGLIKAQMVKNAVIVPVGAKGGFVPMRPPAGGDREAILADGIACYRLFIGALLDISDNLVGGQVAAPDNVVRYDGDDPYLVVAADKGTASFSDIANQLSVERGFWLGDAFASGGSAGYDHKKMGITARGAWELVKRHFRELGRDIQTTPFTCVGVGDMSGDVFGNGMLLSPQTRLVAAFDHRHIFIDPDPDAAASLAERARLFALPRSSWADYNAALISAGGGVFDRKAKSLRLSPQAQKVLGVGETATPAELMRAILQAEVDLLYFGGIGTYVKSSEQANAEVGDRANDAIRIDGRDIRAKVVGEGANLGVTQAGRIEYGRAGGRINTDAIDNSAGVDCSDHEVNIKILLSGIVAAGDMTAKQRDKLLADMTDEVGDLVLRDNYLQGQALTMAQAQGGGALDKQARFIRTLEKRGRLDRAVEGLPSDDEMAARRAAGQGLSRPELAVALAYAKMSLFEDLLESDLPDDPFFGVDLAKYFPRPLRKRFPAAIQQHRLRREVISTSMANSMVNRAGITFVTELQEETKAGAGDIGRAYAVIREVFELRPLWLAVEGLDNRVPAAVQAQMLLAVRDLHKQGILWLLRHWPGKLEVEGAVEAYKTGVGELRRSLHPMLGDGAAAEHDRTVTALGEAGVPRDIACRVADLSPLSFALDIVTGARQSGRPVADVGGVYFALGGALGFDWLRSQAAAITPGTEWDAMAIAALLDDLAGGQRALAAQVVASGEGLDQWRAKRAATVERAEALVAELRLHGALDLARLAIAARALYALSRTAA